MGTTGNKSARAPRSRRGASSLPIVPGTSETRCPVGERVETIAGNLRDLKGVIHTVGPNFNPKAQWVQKVVSNGDELLYNAYASSMKVAKANNCKTVAFSPIVCRLFSWIQADARRADDCMPRAATTPTMGSKRRISSPLVSRMRRRQTTAKR